MSSERGCGASACSTFVGSLYIHSSKEFAEKHNLFLHATLDLPLCRCKGQRNGGECSAANINRETNGVE